MLLSLWIKNTDIRVLCSSVSVRGIINETRLYLMRPSKDSENETHFSSCQLFDRDRDGILTIKELQMLLRCLGLKPDLDQVLSTSRKFKLRRSISQAKAMASQVSVDLTGFSVSYNEYFRYLWRQLRFKSL